METPTIKYHQDVSLAPGCDLLVCGGGPAGCAAALAARRAGLRVVLIEQTGQLGGAGTSGGVTILLGGRTTGGQKAVSGIFDEIVHRLLRCGGAVDPLGWTEKKYQPFGWYSSLAHGISFEPHAAVRVLDEMMAEARVDLVYFTTFVDVILKDHSITYVLVHNKSGLQAIPCTAVIDATGDADVATRSGCDVIKGRKDDGLMTPATLVFCVDRVDQEALSRYIHEHDSPRFRALIERLRANGEWPFPYDIFISLQVVDDDVFMINTSRLCHVDGTDARSMTDGIIRGRQETEQLFTLMRKHFPGFAHARIRWVAPVIGIRETRRIISDYVLSVADLLSGKAFDDTIGLSAYGWDLPDPNRPSYQPMHEKKIARSLFTPIPYRILVPKPLTNLICPGRAVSCERDVLGPLRVMAPCMAMGEATGLAAYQVVEKGIAFSDVDVVSLRTKLRDVGAIVDRPDASIS